MQISVIDVGQPTTHAGNNGRSYQMIEVAYKNESGQIQQKKLFSFRNPDVFKSAQTWEKGQAIHVQAEKNEKGYWEWIGLGEAAANSSPSPTASKPSGNTRVTGSNYETKEERAARQVMIVRQSSISSAVSALTASNNVPSSEDILSLAKQFEDFVMSNETTPNKADGGVDNFEDDVPF
jgi:hypothetical protein